MKDERKFKALVVFTSVLCLFVLFYNVSGGNLLDELEGYLKRRIYYEQVISKKGLGLYNAMHWKADK